MEADMQMQQKHRKEKNEKFMKPTAVKTNEFSKYQNIS